MRLAFHDEPVSIGDGECTVHGTTNIYVVFLGLENHTKKVSVGFMCEECWQIHGEETLLTEKEYSIEEFTKTFYFEDSTRDN